MRNRPFPRPMSVLIAFLAFAVLLRSDARAESSVPQQLNSITVVGSNDVRLTLGQNQAVGAISISDGKRGVATTIWLPIPVFADVLRALAAAPDQIDTLPIADVEQVVHGVPVALRQGVVGSVLIGLTRRKGLPPHERGLLSVKLHRGDETWTTRVEIEGARIRPAVTRLAEFFR